MAEAVVALFSTEQIARILDVPPAEVRRWVRGGLLRPARIERRSAFFAFKDVAASRAVAALTRAGVTPRRIERSLRQIGEWLPDAHDHLTRMEASGRAGGSAGASGRGVRVRLRSGQAADPSGQLLLDLAGAAGPGRPAAARIITLHPAPDADSAEAWFDAGVRAEEAGANEQAVIAYRRAVARGAASAEVDFNLGNALYALGRSADAADSYLRAVGRESGYVEAWNNLGNALIDAGRTADAIDAYRRAVALDPRYADAHSNLAQALAQVGRTAEARRHRQAYLREAAGGDRRSRWQLLSRQRPEIS